VKLLVIIMEEMANLAVLTACIIAIFIIVLCCAIVEFLNRRGR
jgi:hypothetical protein